MFSRIRSRVYGGVHLATELQVYLYRKNVYLPAKIRIKYALKGILQPEVAIFFLVYGLIIYRSSSGAPKNRAFLVAHGILASFLQSLTTEADEVSRHEKFRVHC